MLGRFLCQMMPVRAVVAPMKGGFPAEHITAG